MEVQWGKWVSCGPAITASSLDGQVVFTSNLCTELNYCLANSLIEVSLSKHDFAAPFTQDCLRLSIACAGLNLWIKSCLILLSFPKPTVVQEQNSVLKLDVVCFKLHIRLYVIGAWNPYYKRLPFCPTCGGKMGSSMSSVLTADLHHVHQLPLAMKKKTLL